MSKSKIHRMQQWFATVTCGLAMTWIAGTTQAATITDRQATWPTSPDAQTIDVLSNDPTPSDRIIRDDRHIRQTFAVDQSFTVGSIVLSWGEYNNTAFTISLFEVADIEAATWVAGTHVGSTITVDPFGSTLIGNGNLEIVLSGSEQFLIPQRNTGTTGYGMELAMVNDTQTAGRWKHMLGIADQVPGRYYQEDGTGQPLDRDMGLALVVVPEPTTLMLSLASLTLIATRRRYK